MRKAVGVPFGLRPELAALINTIADNPDDDTARLVAADWLEENGAERWAAFVRAQVRAERESLGSGSLSERSITSQSWFVNPRDIDNNTVTVQRLASLNASALSQFSERNDPRSMGVIALQSATYRNVTTANYPHVAWRGGFLYSLRWFNADAVARFVMSGAHAWHPFPRPAMEAPPGWVQLIGTVCRCWFSHAPFANRLYPAYDVGFLNPTGATIWTVPGYAAIANCVPWQIARHMVSGQTMPNRFEPYLTKPYGTPVPGTARKGGGWFRIMYREHSTAELDLNRAAEWFLYESAKAARDAIISQTQGG